MNKAFKRALSPNKIFTLWSLSFYDNTLSPLGLGFKEMKNGELKQVNSKEK